MTDSKQTPCHVSLIVIGDEILNGRTRDLNGSWLTKFLFKSGLQLKSMRFVHDNDQEIERALHESFLESDIVITSGGVGPTEDDITKKVLSKFFSSPIVEREDVARLVEKNYQRFNRPWQKNLNFYHFFPRDLIAVNNPAGLAPGLVHFDPLKEKLLMAAPGVPKEFMQMVELEFLPLIKKYFEDRLIPIHQTVIRTRGVPEEKIFFELCPDLWSELENYGKVSSLPHTIGIDIVVTYTGDQALCLKKETEIKNIISRSKLSPYVWQYGNSPVSELALSCALEKKLTFSFAESCTGGLASSKITDLSGSSKAFIGSVVSYANSAKNKLIDVDMSLINQHGAVSLEVARAMALGAKEKFGTDVSVSITGIAGPDGGSVEKPVGTVVIGCAHKDGLWAEKFWFPGDRSRLKDRFSDMALLILYQAMKGELKSRVQ